MDLTPADSASQQEFSVGGSSLDGVLAPLGSLSDYVARVVAVGVVNPELFKAALDVYFKCYSSGCAAAASAAASVGGASIVGGEKGVSCRPLSSVSRLSAGTSGCSSCTGCSGRSLPVKTSAAGLRTTTFRSSSSSASQSAPQNGYCYIPLAATGSRTSLRRLLGAWPTVESLLSVPESLVSMQALEAYTAVRVAEGRYHVAPLGSAASQFSLKHVLAQSASWVDQVSVLPGSLGARLIADGVSPPFVGADVPRPGERLGGAQTSRVCEVGLLEFQPVERGLYFSVQSAKGECVTVISFGHPVFIESACCAAGCVMPRSSRGNSCSDFVVCCSHKLYIHLAAGHRSAVVRVLRIRSGLSSAEPRSIACSVASGLSLVRREVVSMENVWIVGSVAGEDLDSLDVSIGEDLAKGKVGGRTWDEFVSRSAACLVGGSEVAVESARVCVPVVADYAHGSSGCVVVVGEGDVGYCTLVSFSFGVIVSSVCCAAGCVSSTLCGDGNDYKSVVVGCAHKLFVKLSPASAVPVAKVLRVGSSDLVFDSSLVRRRDLSDCVRSARSMATSAAVGQPGFGSVLHSFVLTGESGEDDLTVKYMSKAFFVHGMAGGMPWDEFVYSSHPTVVLEPLYS